MPAAIPLIAEFVIQAVVSYVVGQIVGAIVQAAFGSKPSQNQQGASSSASAAGQQQMARSSLANRTVVYGESKISGPLVYASTTGGNNTYLHMVVALVGHEVDSIGDVYFNDIAIPASAMDVHGNVTSGTYSGLARIHKYTGAPGQVADADLMAEDPNWPSTSTGDGVAYLYVRLIWDQTVYATGIPNVSAVVRGKRVLDPRTGTTAWSANWALCMRDYLADADYGLGCDSTEIDDASVIAAANISDERAAGPIYSNDFTADPVTDLLTFANREANFVTGHGVQLTTTGTLPAPLALATTYYFIRSGDSAGGLATTVANAFAGVHIDITAAGSGTHSMAFHDGPRYTVNGIINTGDKPLDITQKLVNAGGARSVYTGGTWRIFAGAYRAPSGVLNISDLAGDLDITVRTERQSLFNGVSGTYISAFNQWQADNFPTITSATYEAQDGGGQILQDIDLPFTNDVVMAQRLAKLVLEQARLQTSTTWPGKFTCFKYDVVDNLQVNVAQLGWALKEFLVTDWKFGASSGVVLALKEESAASYAWGAGDAQAVYAPPETTFPNPLVGVATTGLALASGAAQLFLAGDGTIVSRLLATWDAPTNEFVISGGSVQVQYKRSDLTAWQDTPVLIGSASQTYISPVQDGTFYDVRVRQLNSLKAAGAWAEIDNYQVVGNTAPPPDPTGLTAQQSGNGVVLFSVDEITALNLKRIEIRQLDLNDVAWANGVPICNILKGLTHSTTVIQPGSWTFLARSFDWNENPSAGTARADLTVDRDGFTTIIERQDSPLWLGVTVNFVRHYLGSLVPESQSLASAMGEELWDEFVHNPFPICTYEAPEIDKGIDGNVRVWADIVSALGPGASGVANPTNQIDYRLSAGSYDGFETWNLGFANFRYLKSKLVLDTSVGIARINLFHTVIDALPRTEEKHGLTFAAGGQAITYDAPFHALPQVTIINDGSAPLLPTHTADTTTGTTGHLFNPSTSVDVGGTGGYRVNGV